MTAEYARLSMKMGVIMAALDHILGTGTKFQDELRPYAFAFTEEMYQRLRAYAVEIGLSEDWIVAVEADIAIKVIEYD